MNLAKLVDESRKVESVNIVNSKETWKDRIIAFMTAKDDPACTYEEILANTDIKFSENMSRQELDRRRHCLDSQFTYIRNDYNIRTRHVDDKIVLLGIERDGEILPFNNVSDALLK